MPWSQTQRKRLAMEKDILESYFKDKIIWNSPTSDTSVDLKVTTTSSHCYTLRIYLPSDYPNSCPELTVASPKILKRYNGSLLNGSATTTDHTYGVKNGLVKMSFLSRKMDGRVYDVPSVHERFSVVRGV